VFLGITVTLSAFAPAPTSPGTLATILVGYVLIYAAMLLIPISIGVAILRQHLWDIDLIINRTLVYGALTTSVVLLYVLVVGGLGELLHVRGNLIISLLATGLAAVLFQPLRYRLQRGANHLMYGERDEPYTVLSRLGERLESTLSPAAVLPTVVQTVKEALKLPYVAIELKRDATFETVASAGEPAQDPQRLLLVYGGETVGRLVLRPRAGDDAFTAADQHLLGDLAHQIGVAAHAVRLTDGRGLEALCRPPALPWAPDHGPGGGTAQAKARPARRPRPQLASLTMAAEAARDLSSRTTPNAPKISSAT